MVLRVQVELQVLQELVELAELQVLQEQVEHQVKAVLQVLQD